MSKIELPSITSGYNLSAINNNFQKIEDALNEEVLYRKGYVGEPNEMETNLDMNGKEILNVSVGSSSGSLATKGYVDQEIAEVSGELETKYDKSGGPLSGPIQLNGNNIVGAGETTAFKTSTSLLYINGVQVMPSDLVIDPGNGTRESLRRSYAGAGYNMVTGNFEVGGTLTSQTDVLLSEISGIAYSGPGPFPQTVVPGTDPTLGGFVDRSKDISEESPSYTKIRTYSGGASRIYCTGRSNIFDGASGWFMRDPADLSSADDDGTVLIDSLNRRWKRQWSDDILPEWFGAIGDGVVDDGIAINKAIVLAEARRHSVYFQFDNYLTGTPLIVKTGVGLSIRGKNKGRTTITKTALTAPNVTRTYNAVTFNFDTPCILALVADNESYVRHLCVSDINFIGLTGDITQTHIFAPRATYNVYENIDSTGGKSLWEAKAGGFVNTFINVRSNLKSIHWDVENGNAYSLYNTYANSNVISSDSSTGYSFKDCNVNIHGGDTDGLNFGYLALGATKMSLLGCNTEARLRQVNSRDNSSIDVHGGRYGLTMVGSQASFTAACFWSEGAGKIDVYSTKAFKFDFTGGSPTNKSLAIASGSGQVTLHDADLSISGIVSGVAFTESDIVSTGDGKIEVLRSGRTLNYATNHRSAADFGVTSAKRIQKSLDFASGAVQTLLTLSTADFNEVLIGDVSVMYRSVGNNGLGSVSGLAQLRVTGSLRNTSTVNLQQSGSQLCPDGVANTITFSATISGGVVTLVATASTVNVGSCAVLLDVSGMIIRANGEQDYLTIV